MRTAAQRAGDAAEAAAERYLADRGWHVLARHVRVGRDELDIVAVDPGPPASLVIVEVRWRARRDFGLPEETVDGRKRARLHRAGYALRDAGWLPRTATDATAAGPPDATVLPHLPLRFDLIVVEPGNRLRHHRHGA